MSETAALHLETARKRSAPSSQKNAVLFSLEPRSTTNPPSLEALAAFEAPLEMSMMLSLTSTLVVSIVVVVPLTVRLPDTVTSAAETFPLKLAL